MNVFVEAVKEQAEISMLQDCLDHQHKIYALSGCQEANKAQLIYGISEQAGHKLVIAADENEARKLCEEYSFFCDAAYFYPAKDLLFYQSDIRSNTLVQERIRTLKALFTQEEVVIFTTFEALMNKIPSQESFQQGQIHISLDSQVNLDELRSQLVSCGYVAVTQVEGAGEFAVRGGIVDIFSLTEERPFRMELFGDEVDSLRSFEVTTQKSLETLSDIWIYPAREIVLDKQTQMDGLERIKKDTDVLYKEFRAQQKTEEAYRLKTNFQKLQEQFEELENGQNVEAYLPYFCDKTYSLIDYLDQDAVIFMDEPLRISESAKACEFEFEESMKHRLEGGYLLSVQTQMLFTEAQIWKKCERYAGVCLSLLDYRNLPLPIATHFYLHTTSIVSFNNSFELLIKALEDYRKKKMKVVLVSPSRTRAKRLAEELMDHDIISFYSAKDSRSVHPGEVLVTVGLLRQGFEYPQTGYAFIAESDIFATNHKKKKHVKLYEGEKINSLSDLGVGDYVIHENYGLGIYQGMEKIEVDHIMKDYIKISYAKGSNLYILATQFDMIGKYGMASDRKPRLNSLDGKEWEKTKSRVKGAVGEIAKELVELYAVRQETKGFVYDADNDMQTEFEETFPYEETESQFQAIEDVKTDMMSSKIMDRLICGDVGYGKTEIAIRAAFKAVLNGKQVVYLVPTTILAQQHYNTFVQRMAAYPISVELLCRFKTAAENKKTVEKLKHGQVDIVIGTHRVLSKDVFFKNLGLLIIDEEQRFGVTHKERIKQMKHDVDVLSLSATPIPRTLHMSLIGIRDMSVLEEAPMERTPIQTFVFEQNPEMVREAIVREMARGGQVYYVSNRIREIADVTAQVQALVPDVNVAYAHGQMSETHLEKIMYGFINHEIDVLVATTIIEIGLDISNVNTIIIHDADQLGLSQLYQLRGRVGRSNRTAYAFLMYRKDKMLKEVAEKRLAAIREFTDLGSGFKIAMRDLEIRGAGNMLGEAQHGHMEAVGYDLYCKMLSEAVKEEKGEEVVTYFETTVDLSMDAYIPAGYIEDEGLKLDMYRRISLILNEEDEENIYDELVDRFGDLPKSVQNLLFIARLKALAHRAYVTEIKQKEQEVVISFLPSGKLNPAHLPELIERYQPLLEFSARKEAPAFHLYYTRNNKWPRSELADRLYELLQEIYRQMVE